METKKPVANCQARKPVLINCSEPKITDQSYKKQCDINRIVALYKKTGMLPSFQQKHGQYLDTSETPTLMEAFERTQHALEAFQDLPAIVRKAIDNDPLKLAEFVSDSKNKEFLQKHGVLDTNPGVKTVEKTPTIDEPATVEKTIES